MLKQKARTDMELIDKKWMLFCVGRLFQKPYKGKAYTKSQLNALEFGPITAHYVTRTNNNNGVSAIVNLSEIVEGIEDGNALVIGDTTATISYQENKFICADHIVILRADWLNAYTGIFIKSILDAEKYKYSYGRAFNIDFIVNAEISLPIDSNGNPDWDWIEQYMKSLEADLDKQVDDIMEVVDGDKDIIKIFADQVEIRDFKAWLDDNANMNVDCQLSLDVKKWKPFVTSRLFPVMEQGKANQQILEDGNDCFYVGAKKSNNGVMRTCLRDEKLITKGNCIVFICNGDGSVGYANYFEDDFIGTSDIIAGYNDSLNRYTGLFLATIYSKERFKYSHARKWKPYLMETTIMLPVKCSTNGKPIIDNEKKYSDDGFIPDWNWIERYMKSLPYSDKEKKM